MPCHSYKYYLIQNAGFAFFQTNRIGFRQFKLFYRVSVFRFCTSLLFSSHESDRMWNVDWVEDSPWSGEEGGLVSKSGLNWDGRGHVPVCRHYGVAAAVEI